jgi:hypothetical protein
MDFPDAVWEIDLVAHQRHLLSAELEKTRREIGGRK